MNKQKYPDSIVDDNGKMLRISELPAGYVINLKGHKIKVADIPLVAATLECSHTVRGIALRENDVIFCEVDAKLVPIVKVFR